ncbi:MAG: hypothetical protein WC807_16680 [Hyphomicrobium sp.]|jgi:O-antigen/teichoic acid export membrane protein
MKHRSILLSFAEQGFASLATLAMTVSVIARSSPEEFGQFSFAFTLVLIAASLQYGLVGTSVLVEVRPLDAAGRSQALQTLFAFDFYYRCAAATVIAAALLVVSHDVILSSAAGIFALTYLWRETTRNALFATDEAARATALGTLSFALLMALLAATLPSLRSAALAVFISSALANAAGLGFAAKHFITWPGCPLAAVRTYRNRFPMTGWILANSAANEAQTRAHVLALQLFRGADQLGIIEAARVLFAPLLLISAAWQRVAQPQLASLVADGKHDAARRLTLVGVAIVGGIALLYSAIVYIVYDYLAPRLFGNRFGDVSSYAAAWAICSTLILANWTLISFMNAIRAFRRVAVVVAVAAASTLLLLLLLAFDVPLILALVIPILVQAAVFVTLFASLWVAAPVENARGAGRL